MACTLPTITAALCLLVSPSSAIPMLRADAVRFSICDDATDSVRSRMASSGIGPVAISAS